MNFSAYQDCDTVNGSGIRCSLWVSGCTVGCRGCFSPAAHDFNYGKEYTQEFEDKILEDLKRDFIKGLSILGGHMFEDRNFETCLA